ncbi:uncharacterized protein CELE_T02E1.6 [Caenorhabditis elegans]|uniref:Transmembrane protein n=1 Tax=Caenorhabditis elegans TaxID=6239 RepID=O02291_CAEEL|nr:Transmembrane protein [Caenorhabditis elegans]CAB04661.2 Transmembrane protein [Caenorhabditis elegans]|eukprot:NP_492236.2 Uncharacterized protein CELE_T02E1.6 [Caenorhabditis elegans]
MSDRSRSSKPISVTKGLSPPKSRSLKVKREREKSPTKGRNGSMQNKPTDTSDLAIDATQWEFSRFKDEVGTVFEDPDIVMKNTVGEATPFLAEQKQIMMIRGEHLKKKPIYTLFFLFLELVIAMMILITWSFFVENNEMIPIILCFVNVIILIIVVLILFAIQFGRLNVVEEALNEDIRFRIPYEWKYWICVMHILRFFLICANITIGVLDNDFDGGVIVLVSGMPVMLILSAGHVFFSLRPQG